MVRYTLATLAGRLQQYDEGEARSMVRILLEDSFGLSYTDICCGALERLTAEDAGRLEECMHRLENGEPLQYVIGTAWFCDREYHVASGVLIPRPETEELCEWIITDVMEDKSADGQSRKLLDIGTGSGCIAITLALGIPSAQVSAWDISDEALTIAKGNAEALQAQVAFSKNDALALTEDDSSGMLDVIVSNPPYICNREMEAMDGNVLDHEPHLALFVPDDDPLLFYRAIAEYGTKALRKGGRLYFEINPIYADDMLAMLQGLGYGDIVLREDQFGKQRMMRATFSKLK